MDSNEDPVSPGEGFISLYSAAGYDFPSSPPENNDNAMSDASSVLSEPPPDMDFDFEPQFNTDWFDPQFNNIPILYETEEGPPLNTLFAWPFDELPEVSDSDPNSEDDPDYEDFLVDENEHTAASRAAKSGPLEKFYKLKINSTVTEFEKLPYELIIRIASLLPSDSDLASFMMTCYTFARQLQPENSSVWKERFLQKYDYPIIKGPYEFRIAYQLRAIALPRFGDLGFETRNNAKVLLKILKDMVLETYNKPDSRYPNPQISPNILAFSDAMKSEWMVHFLATRLFARDHQHPYGRLPNNKLFDVLQVAFSYLVLNRSPMAFQVGCDKTDYDLARVYNWNQPLSLLYRYVPEDPSQPLEWSVTYHLHFTLDINTLVHIRNYWHRHLTEAKAMGGEETFANMAADLAKFGISPKPWTQPLQQPSKLQKKWYGHYSCIYPWPKSRRQLDEKESEAEVWDTVDPLYLNFNIPRTVEAAWPTIFSSILAFIEARLCAIPGKGAFFIRGLAPFKSPRNIRTPQHMLSIQHHHPFTRMRLRGFIHPIKPQSGIPGWQRILFVLYKPTFRYLNEVFDNATDYFGEPFEQTLNDINAALDVDMTHAEIEGHYQARLETLLGNLKGPSKLSGEMIQGMEDALHDPKALEWANIEHAYAYEGVVTPGGMVMLGRWWRIGPPGPWAVGDLAEFVCPERLDDRERGPFVFWAA